MPKKVGLNIRVSPEIRGFVKKKAIDKSLTMAALVEQIILEWQKMDSEQNGNL